MSRWMHEIEAIDPRNTPVDPEIKWTTGFMRSYFDILQKNGHTKKIARLKLVQEVLNSCTIMIYKGWSRPDTETSFVYVGVPDKDFKNIGIEAPPPPNMVFLTFVFPDGKINDWTWRKSNNDHIPDGFEKGTLIWEA